MNSLLRKSLNNNKNKLGVLLTNNFKNFSKITSLGMFKADPLQNYNKSLFVYNRKHFCEKPKKDNDTKDTDKPPKGFERFYRSKKASSKIDENKTSKDNKDEDPNKKSNYIKY
jgi:hypothetical protein